MTAEIFELGPVTLNSSNLHTVFFIAEGDDASGWVKGNLHIDFRSGRSYCYYDVPEDVAIGLASTEDPSAFFNERVKDVYPFDEI
jgi:hypothetical protein